ncbi:MAG: hypothetical protein ABIF71_03385, partial [Planctomycetota bacterium]
KMKAPGAEAQVEMGIPLFSFDDGFLVRQARSTEFKVRLGIGAFYLLEGNTGQAQAVFQKLAEDPAQAPTLAPFLARTGAVAATQDAAKDAESQKNLRILLSQQIKFAVKSFEADKYDAALVNTGKIIAKAGDRMDFLTAVSKECHELSGKYLPEFVQLLVEGCPVCKQTRLVECPRCGGKGKVKPIMGGLVLCGPCKGAGKVACSDCDKRYTTAANKKQVTALRALFRRDEKPKAAPADGAPAPAPMEEVPAGTNPIEGTI